MTLKDNGKNQTLEELAGLRRQQVATVMPLIGPLLDAWDGAPNDEKNPESALYRVMESIAAAMEGTPRRDVALVPTKPTPDMLARCAHAVWPAAGPADMAIAKEALVKLATLGDWPADRTSEVQATLATMAVGYRTMIAESQRHG